VTTPSKTNRKARLTTLASERRAKRVRSSVEQGGPCVWTGGPPILLSHSAIVGLTGIVLFFALLQISVSFATYGRRSVAAWNTRAWRIDGST
jgi:hypothetical protein